MWRKMAPVFVMVLIAVVGMVTATVASSAPAPDPRRLNAYHLAFTEAYNDWQAQASTFSMSSPDVMERARELWLRNEVGEKFRRLESALRGEE